MDILSTAIGFLLGTATGAAGSYFASKFTDQRRKKEAMRTQARIFESLWDRYRELMLEMKEDLERPEHANQREFFLLNSQWGFSHGDPYLAYHLDKHDRLEQQVKALEDHGFARNITEPGKKVGKYWFEEHFVELLKAKKI